MLPLRSIPYCNVLQSMTILQVLHASACMLTPRQYTWSCTLFPLTDLKTDGVRAYEGYELNQEEDIMWSGSMRLLVFVQMRGWRERPAACWVFTRIIADLLYRVYQASQSDIIDPNLKKGAIWHYALETDGKWVNTCSLLLDLLENEYRNNTRLNVSSQGSILNISNRCQHKQIVSILQSGAYLSWEVIVGVLREEHEVWRHVRDDIMCMSNLK